METRHRIFASDGVPLVYWRWRAGRRRRPPLLLLHGAASNHTRWSEFLDRTELKRSWDVIRPDLRGNGDSMVRGRLDLGVWSRDLAELLDAEGDDAALVVGHSLGAQIALRFAHDYPRRVLGLVLIDPVFRRALTGRPRRVSRARPLVVAAMRAARALNALGLYRRRIVPGRDLRELDEETRRALRGGRSHAEIARRYSALGPILRHMPVANYLQQLLATAADPPPPEEILAPTLVLLSTGVTFAEAEVNRREIGRFPNAETVAIEANHWPLTEKPGDVRRAIEAWIGRTFGRGPSHRGPAVQ